MKPKPYKIALGACGIIAAIAFGIGITEDNYENHETKTVAVQEEKKEEKKSPPPKEEETVKYYTPEQYRDFLQEDLGSEVTYDPEEKAFFIFDDDPQLAEEIAATYTGMLPPDSWNKMVDVFVKLSGQTEELLGESGYVLLYCNPVDRELVILGAMDGVLLYDYITGFNVDSEDM